ncbi:hypothetical protein GGQ64_000186 [Rhizobium azooxidifex]|uniref:Serine protease n=1 Tax=Mycoplana azooxidifex TaxID=1636188 RepID=A0A7W6D1J8_9HYPH|nr:hypothetical protein [Mycoplana azooxidifex]MBB3975010.1 hypothetical protein [Mycoplana azooxidifex]
MAKGRISARWLSRTASAVSDVAADICQLPNVSHVTLGRKCKGGVPTSQRALITYVYRKHAVGRAYEVPPSVRVQSRELATDVVELPSAPRLLGVRGGDLIYTSSEFGTGCIAFRKDGTGFIATNAHVVGDVRTRRLDASLAVQEPATAKNFPLGPVRYISQFPEGAITNEDLAVVEVPGLVVDDWFIYGEASPISAFSGFASHLDETYWYSTRGARVTCVRPEPLPANQSVPMLVDGHWYRYTGFWGLRAVRGAVTPGHSGAILCRGEGASIVACGILFGGAPPDYAYVFPLQPRLNNVIAAL